MTTSREIAENARAWPFEEARKVVKRLKAKNKGALKTPEKGYVLFETGYGPSGLPHIGTFGEVLRTTMVRHAFEVLSGLPTKLIAFSDDMDGLRKVPGNVPNQELLAGALGKPLTEVPDPFGTHDSFGRHNNARLQAFLDSFGFDYEFRSATDCYKSGEFDETLLSVLKNYDAVMNVILPTLGKERQATYSPFLPVCKRTGVVLQVPMIARDPEAGTVTYEDPETGEEIETPVTGGHCKLQWKADWAMRWVALDVDYEMSGKDLIDSTQLSGKIARALGAQPPEGFNYELFLDDKGQKISKSKGNGLTMEEWLAYGTEDSLALFMFQQPKRAKRLYFDQIPKAVDEYRTFLEKYQDEPAEKRIENPVWHIHSGDVPRPEPGVTFSLLLNLASACHAEAPEVLWGFITRYDPEATPESRPRLDKLVGLALAYYRDFVVPKKRYRPATAEEAKALEEVARMLEALPADSPTEEFQSVFYQVGKGLMPDDLRGWFKAVYEILLGQEQGPRMGSFVDLYGRDETV
ncbi:MAG: lysine--tRNA ligase, partial [Alphaproteobacteria bacterium]|nr:lysine--tRNA ligase [Alphaproteobacteria bacterium]